MKQPRPEGLRTRVGFRGSLGVDLVSDSPRPLPAVGGVLSDRSDRHASVASVRDELIEMPTALLVGSCRAVQLAQPWLSFALIELLWPTRHAPHRLTATAN